MAMIMIENIVEYKNIISVAAASDADRRVVDGRGALHVSGDLAGEDGRLAVDEGFAVVSSDGSPQPEAALPEAPDDLAFGGDAGADRDRAEVADVLGEVDDQAGQAGQRGADGPDHERPVGDALAEPGGGGEPLVRVEAVSVAAGRREGFDVGRRERLREADRVADTDGVLAAVRADSLRSTVSTGDTMISRTRTGASVQPPFVIVR